MAIPDGGVPSIVAGRAAFELHCAPCHGPSGQGGYLSPSARPPRIAGADIAKIARHVRQGGREMPAFSAAVLPEATLNDVAAYVHDSLPEPPAGRGLLGPRALDPFDVGAVVWIAIVVFAIGIRTLFHHERT